MKKLSLNNIDDLINDFPQWLEKYRDYLIEKILDCHKLGIIETPCIDFEEQNLCYHEPTIIDEESGEDYMVRWTILGVSVKNGKLMVNCRNYEEQYNVFEYDTCLDVREKVNCLKSITYTLLSLRRNGKKLLSHLHSRNVTL